jgi:hypothetical protein
MDEYKEGRADIREHENQTIRNIKSDNPISRSQASTSAAGSSSSKRSWTLSRQNSKGRDHRQQDYHPASYFSVGSPMPVLWGPPSMMYQPCPPWAGWYGPWTPPLMHFYSGWSGPTQGFDHGGYYAGDDRYEHVGHQQGRRASGHKKWTLWNAKMDHPFS